MKKETAKYSTVDALNTWKAIRKKYHDAIVFIRVGENYFTFGNDAEIVNEITSGKIIRHEEGQKHCSFLFTQLDTFLSKLVKNGHKVAVCDQL